MKYNDPIYVKLEKLDIMIRLASQANIAQVLGELKEYATEVDVDFVRKAVRAIGRCAIKVRIIIISLLQSTAGNRPPPGRYSIPQDPISRFTHPITASYPLQVIGPSGRRASDTTCAEP